MADPYEGLGATDEMMPEPVAAPPAIPGQAQATQKTDPYAGLGSTEELDTAGAKPARDWTSLAKEGAGLLGQHLHSALSWTPGIGAFLNPIEHALGMETPGAAIQAGMQQSTVGNLKDRLWEWGAGKFHDVTGHGPTSEEQRTRDDAYLAKLQQQYAPETLGGQLLGNIGMAYSLGRAFPAATGPVSRIGNASAMSGLLTAYQGATQGQTWDDRVAKAGEGLAEGVITGALLEGALTGLGAGWSKLFGASRTPAPGVNAAERAAQSAQFGINLTAGQATGNVAQQAKEEAMREGAHGMGPQFLMRNRLGEQAQAIEEGAKGLAPESGVSNFGEALQQKIQGTEQAGRNLAGGFYKQAEQTGLTIRPEAVGKLNQKIIGGLEDSGINLSSSLEAPAGTFDQMPATRNAVNLIRNRLLSGNAGPQSLTNIDMTGRLLNAVRPGSGEDARAVKAIQQSYHQWFSDLATRDMFGGNPEGLALIREGKAYAAQYLRLIDEDKGLGQLIKENLSSDQAANYMTNLTSVGQAAKAAMFARRFRGFFGTDSPEWQALQESVVKKATTAAAGTATGEFAADGSALLHPHQVVRNLKMLTDGPGRVAAQEIYTPENLQRIRAFTQAVENTLPVKTFNPSGTAAALWRMIAQNFPLSMAGFAGGIYGLPHKEEEGMKGLIQNGLIGTAASMLLKLPNIGGAASALSPVGKTIPKTFTPAVAPFIVHKLQGQARGGAINKALAIARRH